MPTKVMIKEQLTPLLQQARAQKKRIVFTNGCFDVLHRGHVTYLAQARALGSALVLGVNSDASVKRQGKGDDRPVNHEDDRMAVLAALEAVDLVVLFDEDTPLDLILTCHPDVLVKGGDWIPDRIVGSKEVTAWGGSVHSIPFLHERFVVRLSFADDQIGRPALFQELRGAGLEQRTDAVIPVVDDRRTFVQPRCAGIVKRGIVDDR